MAQTHRLERTSFDTVVIGGGFGGLAAAALLAADGCDVALLEAHTTTGGCGGCFHRYARDRRGDRHRFRFDVGATTLSGLRRGHPLDQLFATLGDPPPVRRIDPGIIAHLDDLRPIRYAGDEAAWHAELARSFPGHDVVGFWKRVAAASATGWSLALTNDRFPPQSLSDLFALARPRNLKGLPLLRRLGRSVDDIVRASIARPPDDFLRFLDELLMITAQSPASIAPFPVAALGLDYPTDTWYVDGGLYGVAEWLERAVRAHGGVVATKRQATSLRRRDGVWRITTTRESVTARRVVANITLWDMIPLLSPEDATYFHAMTADLPPLWGAFVVTAAVGDAFDDHGSLYHQIHCARLPHTDARSIFLSLSPSDDRARAPEGWRVLSISTHLPDPASWIALRRDDRAEYDRRKEGLQTAIWREVERVLPDLGKAERVATESGTPRSFAFFTRRGWGSVGGIPARVDRSIFRQPTHRTPIDGLSLVGDTIFPGQGLPAVVLTALRLVRDLANG